MAHQQTNSVLVYVRMYAVTERGVVGLQATNTTTNNNTNISPILHRFQVMADYWSNFRNRHGIASI